MGTKEQEERVNLRRLRRTGHSFNCISRRGVVQIGSIHAARLSVWSAAATAAALSAGSAAAPALARAQRQLNILVGLVRQ